MGITLRVFDNHFVGENDRATAKRTILHDQRDFLEEVTQRQRRHITVTMPCEREPENTCFDSQQKPPASVERLAVVTPVEDLSEDTTSTEHQSRKAGGLSDATVADETDFDRKVPASTGFDLDESSSISDITTDPALMNYLDSQPAANISFEGTLATAHAVLDQDL